MRAPVDRGPVEGARQWLREQTSVLAWFDLGWLDLEGDDPAADEAISEFLADDCVRVPTPGSGYRWQLSDAIRRLTLHRMGADRARRLSSDSTSKPTGEVQTTLDRLLLGSASAETSPQSDAARTVVSDPASELQVTRWLRGVVEALPDRRTIQRRLSVDELYEPLRSLTRNGFYGRGQWLADLDAFLSGERRTPLVISGVGGVGKSTLIARFVLGALDQDPDLRFAYLNFDRGALEADRPSQLLAEIIRQVALQVPDLDPDASTLAESLRLQEGLDEQSHGSSTRGSASARTDLWEQLLGDAGELLRRGCPDRFLLVFDTFEEVQRQQLADIDLFWSLISDLCELLPGTRALVSGRALDGGLHGDHGAEVRPLRELDRAAAIAMLTTQRDLDVSTELAERVIDLVSASPLSLRLAIDVLRRGRHNDPLLDLELQEGQIQGQLYRRILMHIADPVVRRLAHPGLACRFVTIDTIRHVLAKPCDIHVPDDDTARRLFDALEREATLVVSDGERLRHRADVRALMLPSLERDQATRVARIHRAAVKYYRKQRSLESKAEEMYHRLMLGQTEGTLDKHWHPGVEELLVESIEEMPTRSQSYLASRSGKLVRVSEDVLQSANDGAWARSSATSARAELRAGRSEHALEVIGRRRGSHGESLLPELEVEALEDLGRFDDALAVLEGARDAALRIGESDVAVALILDSLRILERTGRFDEAIERAVALRASLQAGRGESALDFLVVSTALLRLLRRSDRLGSEHDEIADEAARTAERLAYKELSLRPGLLRELLAEIGDRSPRLMKLGIETVGVARGVNDDLDEHLAVVDESLETARPDIGETRGTTAKRVTEYALKVGDSDSGLFNAIRQSYREETDELYSSQPGTDADAGRGSVRLEPAPDGEAKH